MLNPVDPHAWASAIIEVIKGGGWMAFALLGLALICWRPPWRRTKGD